MQKPWGKKKVDIPRRRLDGATQNADVVTPKTGPSLFKRNRTIVGSTSLSVSSVNELGGDLRSSRTHVHHLTAHRRRLGAILMIVIAVAGLLLWFLYEFTAFLQISATSDSFVIDKQRYVRTMNDYYAARPGERLRPLLNEKQLSDYVSQTNPEVKAVHVNGAAGLAMSQVDITFRQPVAGWLIGSKQYYVDKDGVSFQTNYFARPQVKIIDQSGVPQTSGSVVASSRFLRFVGRTVDLARGGGLTVEQAVIPSGTTRQIEVRLAGHSYPIKLSLDRPVGEQVEDMQRAVGYMDSRGLHPQYIDVRVSGKAYYR